MFSVVRTAVFRIKQKNRHQIPLVMVFYWGKNFIGEIRRVLRGLRSDNPLHLLHGARFDLANAFSRHAVFGRQVMQRARIVLGEPARLDNPAATLIQSF